MSMVELNGGGYATEDEALTALTMEARRRGVSYGHLVAATTLREREEIVRVFCAERRRTRRRRK